ncbi:MAG: outer membrane lipoprotein-sorting protein [Desulfococcaceae bacterium]
MNFRVSRLDLKRFFQSFRWISAVLLFFMATPGFSLSAEGETPGAEAPDADTIVEKSFRHMRGDASESRVRMTIHRPDWERTMLLRVWTRGETESLIRIEEPARDAGNGTLKVGTEMWMYNPKVNRVIKVPPSMMSQSWMGSDFSNNDLARSDSLLRDYDHELAGSETRNGMTAYRIVSTPRPAAPVVWGKQEMAIREDHILLEQIFFDEDMVEVKRMTTGDIAERDGRLFPGTMRMVKADAPAEYTLMEYLEIEFLDTLPDRYFTRSALQTPRR